MSDWNEGLAEDLRDLAFARAFVLAAVAEEVPLDVCLRKAARALGADEISRRSQLSKVQVLQALRSQNLPSQHVLEELLGVFGLQLKLEPIAGKKPRRTG